MSDDRFVIGLGILVVWFALGLIVLGATARWLRKVWRRRAELPLSTKFVAMLVAAAALFSSLGAIGGLVKAFGAVGGERIEPSQKARILAEGISDAMNYTALGFLVVVTAIALSRLLKKRTP